MANYLPSRDYLLKLQQKHSTAINSSSGSKEKTRETRDLKANAERMQALKSLESELANRLKETYHYGNTSQDEYSAMRDRLEKVRSEMNAISPGSVQVSASERFGRNLGGTAQQYLGDMADSIAFIGRAANAAHDNSSEERKAINDSIYSGYVTDDLTADNFERDAKEGLIRSDGVISDVKNINTGINAFADRMASEAQKEIEASRQGATGTQRLLLDLESGATGLALDSLANAILPGGAKAAMAVRSFGSGAREAQEVGGNLLQQAATGALRAALSTQIERLSGGAFGKIYGKGALDDVINLAINKIGKTDAGRTAFRLLIDSFAEGGEEWLEAKLDPFVTLVYDKGAGFTQRFSSLDAWKEAASNDLYEGLIGTLLGAFGAGSNVVNGKYYMLNAQQPSPRPGNILLNIYNEGVARQQANAQTQNDKNNARAGVQAEATQAAAGRTEAQGNESVPPRTQQAVQGTSDELNSGFYDGGAPIVYERGRDSYGLPTRDASQMVTEPTAVPQDRLYRQEPNSKSARRETAQDLERQRIDSLSFEEPDAYYDLSWQDAEQIAKEDYDKIEAKLNSLLAQKPMWIEARRKELIATGKATELDAKALATMAFENQVNRAKKNIGDKKSWIEERKKAIMSKNMKSEDSVYDVRREFEEEVRSKIVDDKTLNDSEKFDKIVALAYYYNKRYEGQFVDKSGNVIDAIEGNNGWRLTNNRELVNERNEVPGETSDINEDVDRTYSPIALSNTKVGAQGDKGQFVPEFRSTTSNREDAPANVGTSVTNEMRAAREAEIAKAKELEAKAQKTKLKPTRTTFKDLYKQGKIPDKKIDTIEILPGIPASNSLKNQSSSDNMVANSNGGNINGRENNARPESAAERGNAQAGGKGLSAEKIGADVGGGKQKVSGNNGQSNTGNNAENRQRHIGERVSRGVGDEGLELGNNRVGLDVSGKQDGIILFGNNTFEVTKPNKRDIAFKSWVEKKTGLKARLVYGQMFVNGKKSYGVHNPATGEIVFCIGSKEGYAAALHETLHQRLANVNTESEARVKAAKIYDAFSKNLNADERSKLDSVKQTVSKAYRDATIKNYKDALRNNGWTEEKILEYEDRILEYAERTVKEETLVHIATGLPTGKAGEYIELLRDKARFALLEDGAIESDLFSSFPYAKAEDKTVLAETVAEQTTTSEDNSLPFTFGDEPAVEEPAEAPPVPDVEPETKQPETQPTPTPKQTAKERYDFAYDNIKAKADKVDKLKMFSESKDFKGFHGEKASYAASQEVGKYKKLIRDFSNGHISLTNLRDAFAEMRTNPYMKNFSSQYIVDYLDTAIRAEEVFDSSDASRYDANRYRHAVSNAMDMIAARAEKVNRAVSNQIAIANQIKNRKKPKSPVGNALNHMYTLQLNGPTIFKMIDGFEKAKGGIGYAMQRAAEDCAAVKAIEMTNGKRFFSNFKPGNGYTDFIRGKTMTGVKIGGHELNQQEAITLLGMVRTMRATSSIKMNGLSGIMYYANGEEKLYNFTGDAAVELEALEEKLKGSIKGVARDYEKAMDSMFSYFWPKLAAETRSINGRTAPKGMASYFPLRIKPKNKSLQDFSLEKSLENDYPDYIDGNKPGILKERSDTTGGYLVLEPCSVVVDRYIQQASDYLAYADFGNTLELMNTGSALAPGMSETMEAAWGKNFSKWMDAYVKDMTGVSRSSERNSFDEAIFPLLKKGRQNLAQGALLGNISTPIKQAAGYWPAMGIIKPTSMMRAILAGKTSAKWNPLIEDRRSSLDPTVAELLTETDTWLGKLKSKDNAIGRTIRNVTEWIPKADAGVVNMLFKATVVDVATDNPGLSKNSAEFKRLVENKFEQIMLRTQSTSYKSISAEIQRTDNEWAKMASMFRSQQTMEFNKVVQALGEYAATRGKDGSKEASKYLIDTLGGQIGSALTFSILTVAANLVLHKYDRYEDEEGQIRAANIIKSIAFDSIETMSGIAWLGDAVAQFAIEAISGGEENEFYGLPLGVLNTVVNLLDSFQYLADNPSVSNAKRLLGNLGNLAGVPVNNVYNLVNAVIMHMADLTDNNSQGYDDVIKYLKAQTKVRNDAIDMLINAGLPGTGNVQADFGTTTDGIKAAQQQIKELKADKDGEYDTKGSRAIVDIILGLNLTEKGTDAMVNEHTAKSYSETYSVLRAFGLEPKSAATVYNELDTSGNGNINQDELLKAYKDNPGLSYILERIWNSRGYSKSWDDVT